MFQHFPRRSAASARLPRRVDSLAQQLAHGWGSGSLSVNLQPWGECPPFPRPRGAGDNRSGGDRLRRHIKRPGPTPGTSRAEPAASASEPAGAKHEAATLHVTPTHRAQPVRVNQLGRPAARRHSLPLLLIRGLVDLPEDVRQHPVRPVSGGGVQDAVELDDAHGFGVQDVQLCREPKPASKERRQPGSRRTKRVKSTIRAARARIGCSGSGPEWKTQPAHTLPWASHSLPAAHAEHRGAASHQRRDRGTSEG